jgi:hypothetical protein
MHNRRYLPALTLLFVAIMCCAVRAQDQPNGGYVVHPNQEVRVASLPSTVASSTSESAVLTASLTTAIMQPDVCCDRNSALEARIPSARNMSLKDLGEKLRGKHYLESGLSVQVTDQYWSGASVNIEDIIISLTAQHPLLMEWNGHLYVVYGAVFNEYVYNSGLIQHILKTLLLIDVRFSDQRRYVTFNRQTDDWGKVTELLALTVTR